MSRVLYDLITGSSSLIFESLGIFAILDREGRYVYTSQNWREVFHPAMEHPLGMHVSEFYPDTKAMDAMEKGTPILAWPVRAADQGSTRLFTSYFPILDEKEVIGCAIMTFFRNQDEAMRFSEVFSKVCAERDLYRQELRRLQGVRYSIDQIIGESEAIQQVKRQIRQAARTTSNVLIEGETGTGKELVSHAIHNLSARSVRPLVKLNCAAIPLELAESELFGYEQGAFTGASRGGKMGKFELAGKGTLFLDEINQLSPRIQPKLLRAIQEGEIERVGGTKSIPVDVRLIAATNRSLEEMIQEGKFRIDLYYRLNVIDIRIPPLRERQEDIPLLVDSIIDRLNQQLGTTVSGVDEEVLSRFQVYHWPGNIRELQNFLERAMNEKLTGRLSWRDFSDCFPPIKQSAATFGIGGYRAASTLKKQQERHMIAEALRQCKGNKKRVAEALGISRTLLYNKLKEYRITEWDHT
mgnify:FL=1